MLYGLLILFLFGVNYSTTLKCYSCGDDNIFFSQIKAKPPSCKEMEKTENLELFIFECPEEYQSCVIQFTGKETKRTCDTPAVDDCETANGITYCYCTQDLCNGIKSRIDAHKGLKDIGYPGDDEDYMDMSGHGHLDDNDNNERYDEKKITLGKGYKFKQNLFLLYNSFLILFLLFFVRC